MEHRKDIGELFKDRLDDAKKAPKQALWERLDASLNKRDKKRRTAAWLWYGGAGILLALLFLAGMLATSDSKAIDENATKISSKENNLETERNTTKNKMAPSEAESTITIENQTNVAKTAVPDTVSSTTISPANATKKGTSNTGTTPTKKSVTKDGFKVTTTHEYYNSDLDTTTTSHNKKKIDSLVAANKRMMAIKDSIARKRASDSIKLNKAKTDSIPE